MSQAEFIIVDTTGNQSIWEETSPHDPTTVTLQPYGRATITSDKDQGPWTVCMSSYNGAAAQGGMVFNDNPAGTTATVCLSAGSMGLFNVNVP